jgi:hypothetical protein
MPVAFPNPNALCEGAQSSNWTRSKSSKRADGAVAQRDGGR